MKLYQITRDYLILPLVNIAFLKARHNFKNFISSLIQTLRFSKEKKKWYLVRGPIKKKQNSSYSIVFFELWIYCTFITYNIHTYWLVWYFVNFLKYNKNCTKWNIDVSLGLYTYHGDNKLLWYKIIVHKYMPIHPYRMSKRNKQLDTILYKLVYCSNACIEVLFIFMWAVLQNTYIAV